MMLPLLDEHIVTQKIAILLAIYIRLYAILGGGAYRPGAVIGLQNSQCHYGPTTRGILIKFYKQFSVPDHGQNNALAHTLPTML